ncbi:MAG: hypothetical protein PF541_16270 [Prolixibacteraceae bacterium]|jgi:hypothetical protein|nr:hypothetical protein [Prolixibacteraceae bacterium]
MNNNLKRSILALTLIITFLIKSSDTVKAQQYTIKDRFNVKLAYSKYPQLGFTWHGSDEITPSFQTELNYGLLNYMEIGPYVGYGTFKANDISSTGNYGAILKSNALFYGMNTNVHFFPFLVKSENFRFDLYLSGKLGGFYRLTEEGMFPERGHEWDYGVYAGAAFYFSRHWGIYGEYGYGNYTNARFGLSFKF